MVIGWQNTEKTEKVHGYNGDTIYYGFKNKDTTETAEEGLADMVSDAESFADKGALKYDQTALQNFSKTFYNIMLTAGIFVAVIVGAILGIKFMTSSVGERAEVKKLLVPYVVGCVVVFGGFGIWNLVVTLLETV